ncbi:MAG TPA: 3-dehydroquinate synthase family protein, partial [Candidatus Gracilibacteria bacterium]
MKNISIQIPAEKSKSYNISFFQDHQSLGEALKPYLKSNYLVVTDQNVVHHHFDFFQDFGENLLILEPGEATKRLETIKKILDKGFELGLNRDSRMIAIGGGVVGDLTGFAASLFMRGIEVIQVPTTLLSMVDSSIGGKTGVDNEYGKNLVGSFHQPSAVLIDTSFLDTLQPIEIKNGLGEMVKHGILGSEEHFKHLEQISNIKYPISDIIPFIPESLEVKRKIIQADEKESGIRGHLNLGHTYGHAIEHLSQYKIPHGQAVAMGCVLAGEKALQIGWIDEETCERIQQIFQNFGIETAPPYTE